MKQRHAPWTAQVLTVLLLLSGALVGAAAPAQAADPGAFKGEADNPFGQFDSLVGEPGGLRIRGWAIDPDTVAPIFLWVTVDGVGRHVYANAERGDVGRAFPAYGTDHGFSERISAREGAHRVCVTAANVGIGRHVTLGCRTAVVPGGSPFGNFEEAGRAADGIEIKGWAIDPDTSDPAYLWVTLDGQGRHVYADAERADVARHFPAYGLEHGFAAVIPASAEPHRVCVTISNVGSGRHTELGCRNVGGVVVPDTSPIGNFEAATGGQGVIDVRGWALDPDSSDPIYVWLTVDGVGRHLYANVERGDVARAFPEAGAAHGFLASVPAEPGTRRVCASAANVGPGRHTPLSCRVVVVGTAVEEVAAVTTPTPAPTPSASPTPTPTPTPTTRPGGRPDAGNTGVPAGTSLAVHNGDMVITTHGAVVDGMDIRGTVSVRANDVVIKNSRVRGRAATYNTPLISMNKGNTNLRVLDTEIGPDNPSPYLYGIMGWEFTLERVNIHHVVDSAHVYGPNVTIRASWLHDNVHYENDPNFGGTPTHDDGVQIQKGSNIRLIGNRIEGAYNAAVQITQDQGVTRDVQITGNWLDGGGCTVNVAEKSYGPIQDLMSVDNRFGRGTRHYDCAMIAPRTTPIVARDNYFTDGVYARVRNGG